MVYKAVRNLGAVALLTGTLLSGYGFYKLAAANPAEMKQAEFNRYESMAMGGTVIMIGGVAGLLLGSRRGGEWYL